MSVLCVNLAKVPTVGEKAECRWPVLPGSPGSSRAGSRRAGEDEEAGDIWTTATERGRQTRRVGEERGCI